MKKVYLKSFLVLLAITLVISCTKELINMPKDALTIEKAKAWYEIQNTSTDFILKSSKATKKAEFSPDWKGAIASSNDDFEVVEVPITSSQTKFNFSTQESLERSKNFNEQGYLNSDSHFIIIKNKKTGLREDYIMTIFGNADYMKTNKFNLSKNSYLKRDKDFSGYVLFHNIDGSFINGWMYAAGKIIRSLSPSSASTAEPLFRLKLYAPVTCVDEMVPVTITDYIYYPSTGAIQILDQYVDYETITSCPTGGNGYVNTGGGTGSNSGISPIPTIIITHLDANPCVKQIYDSLMKDNSVMSNSTSMFLGVKPTLTWNIGQIKKDDGLTTASRLTNTVDITLNSSMLDRASDVYIATTMLHESLHAFMWAEVFGNTGKDFSVSDPKLYDEWTKWGDTTNSGFQHNMMADNYRNTIIKGINAYDRSFNRPQRSDEQLQALSWAGLKGTQAWIEFAYSLSNFNNANLADRYVQILSDLSYHKETNNINTCITGTTNFAQ